MLLPELLRNFGSAGKRSVVVWLWFGFYLLFSCADLVHAAAPQPALSLMTMNTENLFDTVHDRGKNDFTYLPLSAKQTIVHQQRCAQVSVPRWRRECLEWDWNEEVLAARLAILGKVILQVGDGRGPDILALQEVENLAVLERLRKEYLQPAGYLPAILLEGDDARGIDVAFLSRLPLHGPPRLHTIPFQDLPEHRRRDTRPILEATFTLPDGGLLTGFGVHFPAPFHPTEMREQAYRCLDSLRRELPPGRLAFAAGDFNTTSMEDGKQDMLDRLVRPGWELAHENGCDGCRGTYYYAPEHNWSFLDMILWARDRQGGWAIKTGSARLVNGIPQQNTARGVPARFDIKGPSGVSDHWPLLVEIAPVVGQ